MKTIPFIRTIIQKHYQEFNDDRKRNISILIIIYLMMIFMMGFWTFIFVYLELWEMLGFGIFV